MTAATPSNGGDWLRWLFMVILAGAISAYVSYKVANYIKENNL